MSQILLMDDGLAEMLAQLLRQPATALALVEGAQWALYTNSIALTHSDVLASFTEASYPGYVRLTDAAADYPAPTVTSHVASTTRSSALSWALPSSGGSVQVYGCLLIASDGSTLLGATVFDGGPYTLAVAGTPVTETPTLSLQSTY